MSDTTYAVIRDEYSYGAYVDADDYTNGGTFAGTGIIVTRVTGDLAERVQARSGKRGEVTITEEHWDNDGGSCVTCSMERMYFTVAVGDEIVYESPSEPVLANEPGAENVTSIFQFNQWLNERVA